MTSTDLHLRESSSTSSSNPKVKKVPEKKKISVPFSYIPSDDGTDENLLILLHGLGDTHLPFTNLGRQLKLPQTAVLALRAPEQIPFLYEDAYQWYTSFDGLGELISRPDPSPALDLLSPLLLYLTAELKWSPERIHLFGFAQGGSVAAEFGVKVWREELGRRRKLIQGSDEGNGKEERGGGVLGSIVSISGPLLSYPTLSSPSPTPVLIMHTSPPAENALSTSDITAFKKAFLVVVEKKVKEEGMPKSKEGWRPIMEFWSQHLGRRMPGEGGGGLYEVMSGMSSS